MPFTDTTLRKTLLVMLRATIAGEAMNARDKTLQIAKAAGYGPHELAEALLTVLQKTQARQNAVTNPITGRWRSTAGIGLRRADISPGKNRSSSRI
jgi:hypothetical protein